MRTFAIWISLVFLLMILSLGGCKKAPQAECSDALKEVFDDFQFAGAIHDLRNLDSISVGRAVPLPAQLSPGIKYIFYHRRLSSVYEFESITIPSRLRRQAVQFKPLGPSDFGYPNEGGPLFTIELEGRCEGRIFNVVDRRISSDQRLSREWASEAYVVELRATE